MRAFARAEFTNTVIVLEDLFITECVSGGLDSSMIYSKGTICSLKVDGVVLWMSQPSVHRSV